jgi:CTP:molybdopterin cytidylyltransferase MocA
MGRPKALVEVDGEPLVRRALRALTDGGLAPVVVVLGARAADVRPLLPSAVEAVEAADWADGMGASLRAGLAALAGRADAAVVHLVDLPGVPAAAVARLAALAGPHALARAAYGGRPGHPVLLGRAHWAGVAAAATGNAGARGYLAGRADVALVECGDLADPDDVDTPEQLAAFGRRRGLP